MEKYYIRNDKGELIACISLNMILRINLFTNEYGEWKTKKYVDGTSKNTFVIKKDTALCTNGIEIYLFTNYYIYRV